MQLATVEPTRDSCCLSMASTAWLLERTWLESHGRLVGVRSCIVLAHLMLLLVLRVIDPAGVATLSGSGRVLLLLLRLLLLVLSISCERRHEHRGLLRVSLVANHLEEVILQLIILV